jgi:1A family penicillin-binding protein
MPKRSYYRKTTKYHHYKTTAHLSRFQKLKKATNFLIKGFFISGLIGFFLLLALFAYYAKDLPNPQEILEKPLSQSTKIYDRTGETLLYEIYEGEKRTVVSFDEISPAIKNAIIAIEDDDFYDHPGIDFKGILRSLWIALKTGGQELQGASTITQQFIRNSLLTPERTLRRKIKEIILSLELERKYSKDEILTFYLNQISFGSNAYGVESASLTFFGKRAQEINLSEAAILASLPKAPTRLSPYGNNPDLLQDRQSLVLARMKEEGYINETEMKAALQEKLEYKQKKAGIKAPHFVMYVREILEDKYGKDMVEKGGLKVVTTLDWKLQEKAQELVTKQAQKNEKAYNAQNAALVSIDPQTGQLLTMVGSRDYFDIQNDGNVNVALRPRQPGSAFKPFAYTAALQKGFTPSTLLYDVKTEFNPNCVYSAVQGKDKYGLDCYHPQNYDLKERGPVTMRQALGQSLNIPAVKTLYLAGVDQTINLAHKLGITTLQDRSRFGLAIVLGGGEVKLIDITSAFGVLANEGKQQQINTILKITDFDGNVLEEVRQNDIKGEQVLEKNTARLINDILSDNEARTPMFGAHSYLYLGENIPAAAKTGTTQEYRDGWTIGYTPNLVTGVWTGNNDNTSMTKTAGVSTAGPIWHDFMIFAMQDRAKLNFNPPDIFKTDKAVLNGKIGGEVVKIDTISGKRVTDLTPPELIEEKTFRQAHSILYYVDKDNPLAARPSNPAQDPQFENWEQAVKSWARDPQRGNWNDEVPPDEEDDIHTIENKPSIKITEPDNGDILEDQTIKIKTDIDTHYSIKQVDFFFDSNFIGSKISKPFDWELTINQEDWLNGRHKISARAYDRYLNSNETSINIYTDITEDDTPVQTQTYEFSLAVDQAEVPPYNFTLEAYKSLKKLKLYYSYHKDLSNSYLITKNWQPHQNNTYTYTWDPDIDQGTYYIYALGEDKDENLVISNALEINFPDLD